jgi:hypothetical protein
VPFTYRGRRKRTTVSSARTECAPRSFSKNTAAELVRASQALARQEYAINDRVRQGLASLNQGLSRVYIPLIVTTARICIHDAEYRSVDLHTSVGPGSIATLSYGRHVLRRNLTRDAHRGCRLEPMWVFLRDGSVTEVVVGNTSAGVLHHYARTSLGTPPELLQFPHRKCSRRCYVLQSVNCALVIIN